MHVMVGSRGSRLGSREVPLLGVIWGDWPLSLPCSTCDTPGVESRRITWRTGAVGVLVGMALGAAALGMTVSAGPVDQGSNRRIDATTVPPGFELVGPPVTLVDPGPDPVATETTPPPILPPAAAAPSTTQPDSTATVAVVPSQSTVSDPAAVDAAKPTLPTLPPILPPNIQPPTLPLNPDTTGHGPTPVVSPPSE